jgi:predicted nuclease with RNAse H fold
VLTAGVDLAADPAGTAVAAISWTATGAVVDVVAVPAGDDVIVELAGRADKIGIDCPLGWPDDFVAFVSAHRTGVAPIPEGVDAKQWRRRLAWRHTDEVARRMTGLVPLSVSADRIGHTAMRCAALQTRLARAGRSVDRSGTGTVVEVYPAASLKVWGLPWRGYKTAKNQAALGAVVDHLQQAAPWLDLGHHEHLCRRSDHALDAVVAALTARAAVQDQVCRPEQRELPAARTEGWIAIPTAQLAALPG